MDLETEVKKLLKEGYSENDILKACEKLKTRELIHHHNGV